MNRPTITLDHVRILDVPDLVAIDRQSFARSWEEDDFVTLLRNRKTTGVVAFRNRERAGFAIYRYTDVGILLLRLAVGPEFRGLGVGLSLVSCVARKLKQRRPTLSILVPDDQLGAHLFLQRCGFIGSVVDVETYRFEFTLIPQLETDYACHGR